MATVTTLPEADVCAAGAHTSGSGRSLLLDAAAGRMVPRPPVWFMRQAGRSLPEYRSLRTGTAMLAACADPDMVTEITLQPVRRHGVDAAILFSDIVVPLVAIGVDIDIVAGTGPVIAHPIRTWADLDVLQPLHAGQVHYVCAAIGQLVAELGAIPLIGFAGAPFTLASYLIEGGPSRDLARTKALMHSDPALWHALLDRLAGIAAAFLRVQVQAGASMVQLFDSWAGTLSAADYAHFVLPHSTRVLGEIKDVPSIHFGVGTAHLLALMQQAGSHVLGVDWRTPLDDAAELLRPGAGGRPVVVQGNLDPALLLADWDVVEAQVRRIVTEGRHADGHIFNLGHGVLPDTDPAVLTRVVELVKSM